MGTGRFDTHAAYILDARMAKTPEIVLGFLSNLRSKLSSLGAKGKRIPVSYINHSICACLLCSRHCVVVGGLWREELCGCVFRSGMGLCACVCLCGRDGLCVLVKCVCACVC